MIKFYVVFSLFLFVCLKAEYHHQGGIDTVYLFNPGKGQNSGQALDYFPQNIFGLPDTNASELIPSSDPKQICSLGLGGEIIVGFKNYIIFDGNGPDFTIFENAFINPVTKKIFAEPAKVSVSEDGINFFEFPYNLLTLEGCAGLTPTNGKGDPFDPQKSGGDKFDLATIGLKRAKFIKITDICNNILDNPNHPFYDPIISGFDLDAVVGLNLISEINNYEIEKKQDEPCKLITKKDGYELLTESPYNYYSIYDYLGKLISYGSFSYCLSLKNYEFDNTTYILIIRTNNKIHFYRLAF